ncbi:MAG: transposase [Aphanothece sp. CMT-3BRIN-NPC111]|jgi:transposase-like protein|nr:transposase [Aphanothece sp. CMT-3BRIN-NPC111]
MSPRKLSDSDKHDIINLYRQLPETTSTLASRYGVSSSTISRLLKSSLSEKEYDALIQQKRTTRTPNIGFEALPEETLPEEALPEGALPEETLPEEAIPEEAIPEAVSQPLAPDIELSASTLASRRLRRRSSAVPAAMEDQAAEAPIQSLDIPVEPEETTIEFIDEREASDEAEASGVEEMLGSGPDQAEVNALEEMLGEDLSDLDDDDDENDDLEDIGEDDWDDDTDDTADAASQNQVETFITDRGANVQVLPLSEASLPKTCYLVVDRAAELIAKPLKDFSDLGKIPAAEVQQKTLPIFDNHRVARRFSNRTQRVIKIPDGRMLQKTCSHLQAKGITRLLIDGQVYSLLH